MTVTAILTLGVVLFALYLAKRTLSANRNWVSLPPGPPRWPIIGNLLDWPKSKDWLKFTEWAETYGEIVHVDVVGTHMIVLNSADLAFSLLDERGMIYSDRPAPHVLSKLIGWEASLSCMDQGYAFRETRRLMQQEIGSRDALAKYSPIIESEVRQFLLRLVDGPCSDQLKSKLRRLASGLVVRLVYGWRANHNGEDELFNLADRVNRDICEAIRPGAFIVDYIRSIELLPDWFPGMGYRKSVKKMNHNLHEFVEVPYQFVKSQLSDGVAPRSLISHYAQALHLDESQEHLLKWTGGALHSGGSDTSSSSYYTFFLAMTLYPEVQRKAKEEIAAVIGNSRIPCIQDREHLPYIEALVKEVYRWGSVGPAGLAHRVVDDDFYNGYWIPKGSIVIANIWRFTRDPSVYSRPGVFDPARFLGPEPERDPRELVFGFGRRVCPGRALADDSVFALCASALAVLDIKPARNPATGVQVIPEVDFDGVTATAAKEFLTDIQPLSAYTTELLRNAIATSD